MTQLPLETVKIDKSLVDTYLPQNDADKDSSQFIKNIVSLVHTLGMKITVEGVEYRWQFDKLKEFGCDYIQGYFFSKPLSGGEIETFIPQKL
ncbi:MAG: EAL domain-containing protein [Treponema sp.]|nr:EAL domain-containing protein [Treponema sp.]